MPETDPQPPLRPAIVALLVVLALVLGGLWLSAHLRANGRLEDCLMAGRRNCAPISADGVVQAPK